MAVVPSRLVHCNVAEGVGKIRQAAGCGRGENPELLCSGLGATVIKLKVQGVGVLQPGRYEVLVVVRCRVVTAKGEHVFTSVGLEVARQIVCNSGVGDV